MLPPRRRCSPIRNFPRCFPRSAADPYRHGNSMPLEVRGPPSRCLTGKRKPAGLMQSRKDAHERNMQYQQATSNICTLKRASAIYRANPLLEPYM
jgi:hypothetical protein